MSLAIESVDDPLLTVAEVAGILKLHQQTIRNWIVAGKLPALRVGRSVRIKRSDFEQLLRQSYRPPARTPRQSASLFSEGV